VSNELIGQLDGWLTDWVIIINFFVQLYLRKCKRSEVQTSIYYLFYLHVCIVLDACLIFDLCFKEMQNSC